MPYKKKINYLGEARGANLQALNNLVIVAVVGGVISGILGFDGLFGFLIFLLYSALGTVIFYGRLRGELGLFYTGFGEVLKSWKGGMMEYIMTWIMVYNIIYVLA